MSATPSMEMPGASKQQAWQNWEMLCNILLAVFFLRFVVLAGNGLVENFRVSTLLLTLKITADAIFFLTRRPAREVSIAPYDWVIAIMGTFAPFLFIPVAGQDHLVGQVIQIFGMGLQLFGILSLNRSFGLVAANRGIKTTGMYRLVRHPLYCAYVVSYFGYVVNQTTLYNATIYLSMVAFLYLRIIAEERLLSGSEEYQQYCKKVRSRLIPYVL